MKRLPLLFIGCLLDSFCFAQALPGARQPKPRFSQRIISFQAPTSEPILVIGSQETSLGSLVVHPQDLAIKEMYRDSVLLSALPGRGKNGIIVGELKSKRPLFRLDHVLELFNVPEEKRSLKVLVNQQPVNPALFLADVQQIEKVEVTKQDPTKPMRLSFDEQEEFLNIVTAK
ncbi:MAG: hypothetical protein ACO1OQ_16990 [Rufibacter sp.]